MKKVLFFGDSITDAQRNRENDGFLGSGYVTVIAGNIGCEYPGQYEFINRGISGNRIVDLYERIKIDCLNLKPDILTIFIGVNDVLHEAAHKNGVENEKFYKIYKMLLEEIKEELPDVKIILIEPFVYEDPETEYALSFILSEVPKRAEMVRKLAKEFDIPCILIKDALDKKISEANQKYYIKDGVHPTTMGHGIIAKEWERVFKKYENL